MEKKSEEALRRLQDLEATLRAKSAAQRKSFLATEAKRRAAEKKWQANRWQALGKIVESRLGTQVTPEELRVRLEHTSTAKRDESGTP